MKKNVNSTGCWAKTRWAYCKIKGSLLNLRSKNVFATIGGTGLHSRRYWILSVGSMIFEKQRPTLRFFGMCMSNLSPSRKPNASGTCRTAAGLERTSLDTSCRIVAFLNRSGKYTTITGSSAQRFRMRVGQDVCIFCSEWREGVAKDDRYLK